MERARGNIIHLTVYLGRKISEPRNLRDGLPVHVVFSFVRVEHTWDVFLTLALL